MVFKTEKHEEREYGCQDTSKIYGFRPDGTVMYEQACHEGKMITVDDTHPEVTVPAVLAASLKKGQFVRFYTSGDWSVPVEVWDAPERKHLIAYLGLAL